MFNFFKRKKEVSSYDDDNYSVTKKQRDIGYEYAKQLSFAVYDAFVDNTLEMTLEKIEKAIKRIRLYGITDMWYKDGVLYIMLSHPGVFIGVKGNEINTITEQLKRTWKIEDYPISKIKLIEDIKPLSEQLEYIKTCFYYSQGDFE
jgi:ribosomal protein S3